MASPNVVEVTDSNFQNEILNSPLPVLVDFWAVWCAPCRAIAPHVEALASEHAGKLRVGKCDIDANPNVPSQFEIRSIPTLVLFQGGREVARQSGAMASAQIAQWARQHNGATA